MSLSIRAKLYIWFTVGVGALTTYCYVPDFAYENFNLVVIGLLALFSLFAEVYRVHILPQHSVSVSTAIYMSAIFIGGGPLAIAIALTALILSEFILRVFLEAEKFTATFRLRKALFNISQGIISVGVAAWVFTVVGGHTAPFTTASDYLPPLLAFFAFILVNISLVSGVISLAEGENFFYQLKFSLRNLHLQVLSLAVLSILIAVIYVSSPWNLFLVAILLFLVNGSLRSYINLRKQAKNTFEKIMDLLSKRDPYTHKHSESVGDLTEAIADEMRIPPDRKEDIVSAARVHDIGKLGIPDSVLLKQGELTEEEWETMKEHPVLGADILSGLAIYEDSVDVVRYEHERWDGSGYPEGLEKEDIPLGSRIVAVADVWNALRTKRPYRGPMSEEEAKEEIKEMSGVKLDPDVVDILLEVVEEGRVEVES